MKITDDELIECLLEAQKRSLSRRSLRRFSDGTYRVEDGGHFYFEYGSHIRPEYLVTPLTTSQLRKRLRKLADEGRIKSTWSHFWIDNDTTHSAFTAARGFYMSRGIPSGRGSKKVADIAALINECYDFIKYMGAK